MDKRVQSRSAKSKSIWHALSDRWPFVGAILLTAIITIWVGLTLNTLFTAPRTTTSVLPQPSTQPSNTLPGVTPTPNSVPPWFQNNAPLPSIPITARSQATSATSQADPPPAVNSASPAIAFSPKPSGAPLLQARYGHLPYQEADPSQLVIVGTYGTGAAQRSEALNQDAANAFTEMVGAASTDGIRIIPISGFRTVADQEKLFQRQINRQGSETAAAQLSAPPGYSEHHSGYAIDIGDGNQPTTDLKFAFEDTAAYRWMQQHAAQFGFELSFPRNNSQGVSFEPWHWRYIGSNRAKAIFSVAHTLQNR